MTGAALYRRIRKKSSAQAGSHADFRASGCERAQFCALCSRAEVVGSLQLLVLNGTTTSPPGDRRHSSSIAFWGAIGPRLHVSHGRPSPAQASRPLSVEGGSRFRAIGRRRDRLIRFWLQPVTARRPRPSRYLKMIASATASRNASCVADRTGALGQMLSLRCELVCDRGMDASLRIASPCLS